MPYTLNTGAAESAGAPTYTTVYAHLASSCYFFLLLLYIHRVYITICMPYTLHTGAAESAGALLGGADIGRARKRAGTLALLVQKYSRS